MYADIVLLLMGLIAIHLSSTRERLIVVSSFLFSCIAAELMIEQYPSYYYLLYLVILTIGSVVSRSLTVVLCFYGQAIVCTGMIWEPDWAYYSYPYIIAILYAVQIGMTGNVRTNDIHWNGSNLNSNNHLAGVGVK